MKKIIATGFAALAIAVAPGIALAAPAFASPDQFNAGQSTVDRSSHFTSPTIYSDPYQSYFYGGEPIFFGHHGFFGHRGFFGHHRS